MAAITQVPLLSEKIGRDRVSQLLNGHRRSQLVAVAAKLGIADRLAGGPMNSDGLADALGVDVARLHRVMRGLVVCGIVRYRDEGTWELSPLGALLRQDVPGSMYAAAIRVHDIYYPAWGALFNALHTREAPFAAALGVPYAERLARDAEEARRFRDFEPWPTELDAALVPEYDFAGARRVVDVGGRGSFLSAILRSHSHLTGELLESSFNAGRAEATLRAAGVLDRCTVVAGDLFASVPSGGDVYVLESVLHKWGDDECALILERCRDAMDGHAALLVVDRVMIETPEISPSRVDYDLLILMLTGGGGERTHAQFSDLLERSGFRLTRVVRTPTPYSLIEAVPVAA